MLFRSFYPGFPQFLFEAVRRASPSHDVCFYGQVNGSQYPSRIRMLNTLTESCLRDGHHLRMHLSGNLATATPITRAVNLGPAYGLNLYRLIRTSRITFDVRGTIETSDGAGAVQDLAGRETANMRLFEATGLGTCLMTEHYDNLTELFEPGKEIVTYSSERDLTEKLRHYLAHEDERQAIAAAGLARCQRDHSMAARAREFDAIIRDKLARRDGVPPVAATRTAAPPPNIERVVASLERLAAKGALQETAVAPVLRQAMEIIASLLSCGDLDRALRLATAARSLKIAMPGLHLARARVFLALGQPDQAREALAEELRDFPRSADGLELLAQMDSASQRHD